MEVIMENQNNRTSNDPLADDPDTSFDNKTEYLSPITSIINHHNSLFGKRTASSKSIDRRDIFDRPLAGLVIIAGFFIAVFLILSIVILIFYKKRNTVFVFEKSVHKGLYDPSDRSVIIGQTSMARSLASRYVESRKDNDQNYTNSELDYDETDDDEEDEDVEYMDNVDYAIMNDGLAAEVHQGQASMPRASYRLPNKNDIYINPQLLPHFCVKSSLGKTATHSNTNSKPSTDLTTMSANQFQVNGCCWNSVEQNKFKCEQLNEAVTPAAVCILTSTLIAFFYLLHY